MLEILTIITFILILFVFLWFITKKIDKSWLAYSILGLELTAVGLSNTNSDLFKFFILLGFALVLIGFIRSDSNC